MSEKNGHINAAVDLEENAVEILRDITSPTEKVTIILSLKLIYLN